MRRIVALFLLTFSAAISLAADSRSPLPRSTPEKQGISSSAILSFIDAADEQIDTMNSFILVRHGSVVAEGWWTPYDAHSPHMLYSLSKSFTSTAVGLAIAEGKLSVDDPVLKFFPEDAPVQPSENLKSMRVSDLLRMSAGHQAEAAVAGTEVWTKTFLAHAVPFKPGTHFLYNTPATYMLSAIVQKATGVTVLEYLRPRLFEPLGIENPSWGTSPQGVTLGGYGLSVRTEDIARFGQLYLQKGMWRGRQVVPSAWVEAATSRQTSNGSNPQSDWDQGYGYQFWRCRNGAFRGDGAFGQYCVVMPAQDAVIAITSGVRNMQAVLNLVWEKLLPAMKSSPQAANRAAEQKLRTRLAGLAVRPVAGQPTSPLAATVSGKRFAFPQNPRGIESMTIEFNGEGAALTVATSSGRSRIPCAFGKWTRSRSAFLNGMDGRMVSNGEQPVAATGAWKTDNRFDVKLCLYETPFYINLSFEFKGNELVFDSEYNVSFGATKLPQLVGRAQ